MLTLLGLVVGFMGVFGLLACIGGLIFSLVTKKGKIGWVIGLVICVLLIPVGLFIIGTSLPDDDPPAQKDNIGNNVTQSVDEDYISAPTVIYTTAAEDNGLSDQKMFVDGTVGKIVKEKGLDTCILETQDGELAIISIPLLTPSSEWDKLVEGDIVRVYFQYLGYSEELDKASGGLLKVDLSVMESDENKTNDSSGTSVTGTPIEDDVFDDDENEWASRFTPINNFRYSLNKEKKEITLIRYIGDLTKVMLSPVYTIDGVDYSLVSLGDNACFFGKTSITSVYIPEGVTYMSDNCFNSCASLKYLYIPTTMESVTASFLDYIHEYTVFCDSTANLPAERDTNDYPEVVDDVSQAYELGDSTGSAINGILAGLMSDSENPIVTEIYFGGTESQWRSIAGR